jgi:hypothetical protein
VSTLVTADALRRHLGARAVALDVVLLVAVGALVAFLVLFTTRPVVDRLLFEGSLGYGSRAVSGTAPAAGDARLAVQPRPELTVAARSTPPSGGARSADLARAQQITAWTFAPGSAATVEDVLAGALARGAVTGEGVLLDQSTAFVLDVQPGDDLVLVSYDSDEDLRECPVAVTGLIRPFHEPGPIGNGGLAVLSDEVCDETLSAPGSAATWLLFDPAARPPDAVSKAAALRSVLTDARAATTLTLAISALGLGLWVLALVRVRSRTQRRLADPVALLVDLGVAPRLVRRLRAAFLGAAGAVAGGLAAVLARSVTMQVTDLYVQRAHLFVVVLVLGAAGFLVGSRGRLDAPRHREGDR